jgi:diphthine-ammonia ligase
MAIYFQPLAEIASCPDAGERFFCSWSGGKDSCLALYRAKTNGAIPSYLVTMLVEDGTRTRSHGLATTVVQQQALSLGIPLATAATSWAQYETSFINALRRLKTQHVSAGVFGDIDIDRHREWEQKVCQAAQLRAYLPLWKSERQVLLQEFLDLGFSAMIVATNAGTLGPEFLGRALDRELIARFADQGIDPSGENGEYHTIVVDGPLFAQPLALTPGETVQRDGYWFLDLGIKPASDGPTEDDTTAQRRPL